MSESVQRFSVQELKKDDHTWVKAMLIELWGSSEMVSRGKLHDASRLPGFAAWSGGKPVGLLTYRIANRECEIVTLDSIEAGKGIGTALINAAKQVAIQAGCKRLWLITTNDNLPALGFYQKRGFLLAKLHRNALKISRQLKPSIPCIGMNGIPIRDEIELEIPLKSL